MCCSLSSGGVCVSNLLPYLIRIINSISYFYEYYKKNQLGYGILFFGRKLGFDHGRDLLYTI